jgi:hypothetical protein
MCCPLLSVYCLKNTSSFDSKFSLSEIVTGSETESSVVSFVSWVEQLCPSDTTNTIIKCLIVLCALRPTYMYVTLRAWRANEGGTTDLPDYSETVHRDRTLFEKLNYKFTLHPAMAHTLCCSALFSIQ